MLPEQPSLRGRKPLALRKYSGRGVWGEGPSPRRSLVLNTYRASRRPGVMTEAIVSSQAVMASADCGGPK